MFIFNFRNCKGLKFIRYVRISYVEIKNIVLGNKLILFFDIVILILNNII